VVVRPKSGFARFWFAPPVALHESHSTESAKTMFPNTKPFVAAVARPQGRDVHRLATVATGESESDVVVTSRLDRDLIAHLESGGRVLLLPDGQKASLPLSNE